MGVAPFFTAVFVDVLRFNAKHQLGGNVVTRGHSPFSPLYCGGNVVTSLYRGHGTRIFADLADSRGFVLGKIYKTSLDFKSDEVFLLEHGFNGFSRITRIRSWENNPYSLRSNFMRIEPRKNPRESA
ncbi:MAG: hypothetical protein FWG87_04770 [Defluviitaleaceae bacterium]|nr:hypothetical protein [Defluviitaleaceae bacterium]